MKEATIVRAVFLWAALCIIAWAPAPAPKPVGPVSPTGEWTLEWNGGEGPCWLEKDGSFGCLWAGTFWLGRWSLEESPEGRTLTVDEWIPAKDEWTPASQHLKWSAQLKPGTLAGPLLGSSGMFRLRKRPAVRP